MKPKLCEKKLSPSTSLTKFPLGHRQIQNAGNFGCLDFIVGVILLIQLSVTDYKILISILTSQFFQSLCIVATQAALCTDLSPMARDFWEIPPFVCRDVLLFNMVDECQKSLEPIFFTVHTFVKTDF